MTLRRSRLLHLSFVLALASGVLCWSQEATPPSQAGVEAIQRLIDQGRYAEAEAEATETLARLSDAGARQTALAAAVTDLLVHALYRGGKAGEPSSLERALAIQESVSGERDAKIAQPLPDAAAFIRNKRYPMESARRNGSPRSKLRFQKICRRETGNVRRICCGGWGPGERG